MSILVTGASGNVGREVVRELRGRGIFPRLASRHRHGWGEEEADGHQFLDLEDSATYSGALEGCRSLFLLRPPHVANVKETLNLLVDAARDAGVQRIVFLSVAGAGEKRWVPHHAVEKKLQSGPPDWTILRPGFFAQNLGTVYRPDIVEEDRIYLPAGSGRVAFVDLRDVGAVAADALVDMEQHAARSYTLTGPASFSFSEVASLLSSAVVRRVTYVPASVLGYCRHLRRGGMGMGQALVQTVLHVGLRFGQAEAIDGTLESLLGRRPHDVASYVRDHASLWS